MTTTSWSTRVRHDSDATYQEWRDEFITKLGVLVTGGFIAADETNITPGAGARPGTNTEQGYAVYHLSDSLHGTAPWYVRLGFGTGGSATEPRIQATVGTTTNGSGVLGGTALSTIDRINGSALQSTDTARQSYMCAVSGFLGILWKDGSGASVAHFSMMRSVDSTAAITVNGGIARWGSGGSSNLTKSQGFRFPTTAAAYTAATSAVNQAFGLNPQAALTTAVSGNLQVMLGWMITPRVEPIFHMCGVLPGELAPGGTFTATLIGTTSHTYITLSTGAGSFGPITVGSAGSISCAMIWE
jgi:hypothetical protein